MKIHRILTKKTLWLVALFFSTSAFCQINHSITVSAGAAIPIGQFGFKTSSNPQSGYAKTGLTASVQYSLMIKKPFGLAASLRVRNNKLNPDPIVENYRATSPYLSWTTNKAAWKTFALMVGPENSFSIDRNISMGLIFLGGIARIEMPEINITGNSVNQTFSIKRTHGTANSFSAVFGTNVKKRIEGSAFLSFNMDFWFIKPTFKKITESYFNQSGNSATAYQFTNSYSIEANTINLSLGLVVEL